MNKNLKDTLWTGAGVATGLLMFALLSQLGVVSVASNAATKARALLPL